MIDRPDYLARILERLRSSPVVALLGPRQCGKTTLARVVSARRQATYFDLEDPADRSRLDNPTFALESLRGLVILDEIQRRPDLLEILRVVVDRPGFGARFLILGSASPWLVKGASESLAGRISFVDLTGFTVGEVGFEDRRRLWERGGLPRSFLAATDAESFRWRADFVRTFLERDIPQLGISVPADTLRRVWTMLAHFHGQVWNAAEFARSLGSTEATARRYLGLLSGAYMVRQLPPWHENLKKRQVKAPKIYLRDTGLLHALLGADGFVALSGHPKVGASWEGFAIEQILALAEKRDAYFWATHAGAELDLLLFTRGKRLGFEIKYEEAPRVTKSMRVAMADLELDSLRIVYPGSTSYPLDERIATLSLADLGSAPLG
ncbi:MAG: ATP-binding protein [Planctomycetes bacterium]|nr:ATP-binding protein [Planctomycetota bacterium]